MGGEMRVAAGARGRRMALLSFCILHSAFCLCIASGCNIVGAVAAKVGPEPTVPAQYTPAKEPTLVLVENFHNPASLQLEAAAVAQVLSEELRTNEVAPIIDPSKAEGLRQSKGVAAYRKMPLDAIGTAVGAKQVIYVDLERFDVDRAPASELYRGQAEARVRVVGENGEVLWPLDAAGGMPVAVRVQPQRAAQGVGDQAARQRLHAALADRVAKLFYNWKSEGSDIGEHAFDE